MKVKIMRTNNPECEIKRLLHSLNFIHFFLKEGGKTFLENAKNRRKSQFGADTTNIYLFVLKALTCYLDYTDFSKHRYFTSHEPFSYNYGYVRFYDIGPGVEISISENADLNSLLVQERFSKKVGCMCWPIFFSHCLGQFGTMQLLFCSITPLGYSASLC